VLLLLAIAAAPALQSAAIEINFGPDRIAVTATYRFFEVPTARFVLIRLPGQAVDFGAGFTGAEETSGLIRLALEPDARGTVVIRYEVSGVRERMPIPVPAIAPQGATRSVEITLRGLDPALDLTDAFPRFSSGPGPWTARLVNVPSVVRLPASGGWSLIRATDATVLVLIAGAALGWIGWVTRVRRRGA
jgi:hypothetical protein